MRDQNVEGLQKGQDDGVCTDVVEDRQNDGQKHDVGNQWKNMKPNTGANSKMEEISVMKLNIRPIHHTTMCR